MSDSQRRVTLRLDGAHFKSTPHQGLRAQCQFTMLSKSPEGLEGWNGKTTLEGTFASLLMDGHKGGIYQATVIPGRVRAGRVEVLVLDITAG